jgi:ATP-binding cassette subfamily F protein 3
MNAIANRVIEVNNGRLSPYLGNYDDYLYKKGLEKEAAEKEIPGKSSVPETAGREPLGRKSKDQKRYEAEVRNRFFRQTQALRQRIQEIESALEQAMQEIQAIETRLADPEVYRKGENIADLVKFHGDLKKRTEALTSEWDTLSLQLEEMEQQREAQLDNLGTGENLDSRANS